MDAAGLFGSMAFSDSVMRARLPKDAYQALRKTVSEGRPLELAVANVVAAAMKEWAVEKGATHFTHWFQPMTGATAEKHDSFVSPTGDGRAVMEFSGAELVRGEPDASSFPSGGLRATFEARGYTVWDTTSCAFVKDGTLYIPTAFCSHGGEALDKKTPLLRSMEAIDRQAMRALRLFGNKTAARVIPTAGAEQEYFLIDTEAYRRRPDLAYAGRTLFGARPPKGQELEDHYFGSIKPRVAAFMKELEEELWKLGVPAKTKHNETAPAQHELAPVFTTASVACDHNQLTMELLKSVANRHGLTCLLHEKPFAGVNGSGKHVNWSLATDAGANLFEPGETPHENAQFLLFLVAAIKAADDYQDLLRISAASAANDHRLGAGEAPPAIVSMFLGDELTGILEAIESGAAYRGNGRREMEIGATVLPRFPRDATDRNRTSPLAFTGNKFEFRMLGSAFSIAGPCIALNTAVAESLRKFADELEGSGDFAASLAALVRREIRAHKRIIFNGNNYSSEWEAEARRRGLSNLRTTPEALPEFTSRKVIELYTRHGVFTEQEMRSRLEIRMEAYCKTIRIEALSMLEIVKASIVPACIGYQNELAELLQRKAALAGSAAGGGAYDSSLESRLLAAISKLSASLLARLAALEEAALESAGGLEILAKAVFYRDRVFAAMAALRESVDELETLVSRKHWPFPVYGEIFASA